MTNRSTQRPRFSLPTLLSYSFVAAIGLFAGMSIAAGRKHDAARSHDPVAVCSDGSEPSTVERGVASSSSGFGVHHAGSAVTDAGVAELADPDEVAARAVELSHKLMDGLETRMQRTVATMPNPSIEGLVNDMDEYLHGVVDGTVGANPELAPVMAEQIESILCDRNGGAGSAGRQMMYLRAMRQRSELATARSFDCFFGTHKQEDVVLWEALDALKNSGLAQPSEIEALRRSATLPQTRMRLMSQDELAAMKRTEPQTAPAEVKVISNEQFSKFLESL